MATTPRKPAKPRSTTAAARRRTTAKTAGAASLPATADKADTPPTSTPSDSPTPVAAPKRTRKAPVATTETPKPAAAPAAAAKPAPKPAPLPKPRSTKRAAPRRVAKPAPTPVTKPALAKSAIAKVADKIGAGWAFAAFAGVIAASAATLLSLRSSTPKPVSSPKPDKGAHQADGTDSSGSFTAGIADEGTIPS